VAGTPMEGLPATPAVREFRLYQAEHLLRQYPFRFDDLPFEPSGNLVLDHDPKTAWALRHLDEFPVDLQRAARETLLRVPGIGPRAADRLIAARRQVALRGPADLRRLGVDIGRGGFFMALRGRPLAPRPPAQQLRLFPHGGHLPAVVWNTPVPPCAYR
jgi:predicted DNA-binding helix-hairpin-helix protein